MQPRLAFAWLTIVLCVVSSASPLLISPAPAYYPRTIVLRNTTHFAVVEKPLGNYSRLVLVAQLNSNGSQPWAEQAVIAQDNTSGVDLANGFLLELEDGALLCAYRHHVWNGSSRVYRIQLSASSDGGRSWALKSTIWSGDTGVWEPYLYTHSLTPHIVRVLYSLELTNGGEQDIVQQESSDGGSTWGSISLRIHTKGSRNGMPGAVELADGSILFVFEGFWGAGWGHFTVNSVRSLDGGQTWTDAAVIYAPPVASNAGSPQVGVCRSGAIWVVFMCNRRTVATAAPPYPTQARPRPASTRLAEPTPRWPDGAHIWACRSSLNTTRPLQPLQWSAPQLLPSPDPTAPTDTALWPSLLHTPAPSPLLALVYQTAGGAAVMSADSLC